MCNLCGKVSPAGVARSELHAMLQAIIHRGPDDEGVMEFGPRALGHRSILYQTTGPTVNDWLNENLQRTAFMPFAPATREQIAPVNARGSVRSP